MIIPKVIKTRPSWKEQKTKLHAQFPELTDNDLDFGEGQKMEMLDKLQAKLGRTPNELEVIALA